MKKTFTLSISLLIAVLLLSNFKTVTHNNGQFIFTMLDEEPVLPDTPYDYTDINIPQNLLDPEPDDGGYGSGIIDSSFFDFVDNDIATLGRVLFYDKKLSALEDISCASCHAQEFSFADNKAKSEGVNNPTKRNSMQLNDIGWTDNMSFFWDMSEGDLREMITLPLKDDNEIGADMNEVAMKLSATDYYPELFTKAFGTPLVNELKIIEALTQFMTSMTTFNSRFDKESEIGFENFTDEEFLGMELFSFACGECHIQGNDIFSFFALEPQDLLDMNPFVFTNGLPVLDGEDDLGAGSWAEGYDRLFKIPTLRNIEVTGPYMHDGRFETLEEVVKFYSEEVEMNEWQLLLPEGGWGFLQEEQDALVAFLKTLTDETFLTDVKFSDPFDITNTVEEETFDRLVIKPNPMGDFSIIELDSAPNSKTQLSIINNQGQEILSDVIKGNTYQLNKANFGSGIYFLNFRQGNKSSTHKLIVQ